MTSRNDHRPEPGSLEASLRELNAAPAEPLVPSRAEDPGSLRPGEHTPASPRAFDAPQPDRPGYTLWGRCGYVPSAGVRGSQR
jgi:hypothetical protein